MPQNAILDEFNKRLADRGIAKVSKSAWSRYAVRKAIQFRKLDEVQRMSGELVASLGTDGPDQVTVAVAEMLKLAAFQRLEEGETSTKGIMELARALSSAVGAQKTSAEHRRRLEDEVRAKVDKAIDKAGEDAQACSSAPTPRRCSSASAKTSTGSSTCDACRGPVPLYGYQQRWFLDRSRFKLGKFARQTGKTFTTTLEVVDDCYEHALQERRTRWVILSRGERQAREAMNEGVKLHAQAYGMAIEATEFDWGGNDGSYRALEVELPHGSKITALPANPDTARGFSSNVFLDEFAFHKDSGAIWKALFPVISAGWKLRITSTPNGKSGKFYELDTAEDKAWSRHSVDIYQAVADGLPRDIEELRAGIADDDAWAQEYELRYLDEASAWLSYDLISSCEDDDAGDPDKYQGGPCFVGRDIGRRNDLHVITVCELIGDVLWERERIEQKRATFADMDAEFDEVMIRYNVARACIDQTGMGEKVVEDAQRRYGGRIEGVLFTARAS
jgi:hypothetical protein